MSVRTRATAAYTKLRPYAPAVSFFGGFAWDAITLGRQIQPSDLFIAFGYLLGAGAILVAIGRGVRFRYSQYLNAVLQFFFGNVFSALFILYFLSSSDLPGYLVVLGLGALLVGNEFLESAYSELTLSWAFFALSAIMFFNFALAHLFRSINPFWFYLGTLLAMLLVVALRRLSTSARRSSAIPAFVAAGAMLALHAANFIPPVPLVKKDMFIAHDVRRANGGYVATIESPGFRFWRSSSAIFHRSGGERVYCFTSVFIPEGIDTTIRHRWQVKGEDGWTTTSVIPFRIAGGRKAGYRGFTFKQNVTPGQWRVIAETTSGAAIGIVEFRLEPGTPDDVKSVTR
ncbi:MAG TPA: DUF2914 domain-containing protein [Thermoanaerobaculia bacterium]|nr:DUF2914 domain-containing protein [Thermoanaerobaculia bacterium]